MQNISYETEQLRKHNVTQQEVEEVLASDLTDYNEMKPSAHGNDRLMFTGWTQAGRILEIGVELFEFEDREHVFHAMDATSEQKERFIKRNGINLI